MPLVGPAGRARQEALHQHGKNAGHWLASSMCAKVQSASHSLKTLKPLIHTGRCCVIYTFANLSPPSPAAGPLAGAKWGTPAASWVNQSPPGLRVDKGSPLPQVWLVTSGPPTQSLGKDSQHCPPVDQAAICSEGQEIREVTTACQGLATPPTG